MTREEFINWFEERFALTKNNIYELGQLYDEVTKPHWISIENELPKENDFILIYGKDGVGVWLYESPNAEEKIIANHVTHWMPLPQPPTIAKNATVNEKGDEE